MNDKIYSLEKVETPRLIIRPIQLGDEVMKIFKIVNFQVLMKKKEAMYIFPRIHIAYHLLKYLGFIRNNFLRNL